MVIDREQREFHAIGHADFVENVGEVPFDGLFGDAEPSSDVFVREPFCDVSNDIEFASRESEGVLSGFSAALSLQFLQELNEV